MAVIPDAHRAIRDLHQKKNRKLKKVPDRPLSLCDCGASGMTITLHLDFYFDDFLRPWPFSDPSCRAGRQGVRKTYPYSRTGDPIGLDDARRDGDCPNGHGQNRRVYVADDRNFIRWSGQGADAAVIGVIAHAGTGRPNRSEF